MLTIRKEHVLLLAFVFNGLLFCYVNGQTLVTTENLVALLEADDITTAKTEISQLLKSDNQNTISEFFVYVTDNQSLHFSTSKFFVEIFKDSNFPFQFMNDPLQESYERNPNITKIISNAILTTIQTSEFNGLIVFISNGLESLQNKNFAVFESLEEALKISGCTENFGEILVKSKESAEVEMDFQMAIVSSANLSTCLHQGLQNQFQFSITTRLSDNLLSEENVNSVFLSLQQLSAAQISEIMNQSVEAGNFKGVVQLLNYYFLNQNVTSEKLSLIVSAMVMANQSDIVLEAIQQTNQLNNLIFMFEHVFSKGNENTIYQFAKLISESVENGECGLSEILNGVFSNSTQIQNVQIIYISQLLTEQGAGVCAELIPLPTPQLKTVPTNSIFGLGPESDIAIIIPEENQKADQNINQKIALQINPDTQGPGPLIEPNAQNVTVDDNNASIRAVQQLNYTVDVTHAQNVTVDDQNVHLNVSLGVSSQGGQICTDIVPPPGKYSCEQQLSWGKCDSEWMISGGFCEFTCGRCCVDVAPDERFTCAQQKQYGKCNEPWMTEHQYCQRTCDRCTVQPPPDEVKFQQKTGNTNCGCSTEYIENLTNLTTTIVKEVVTKILQEVNN